MALSKKLTGNTIEYEFSGYNNFNFLTINLNL